MLPVNFALNENSSSSDNAVTIDLEPGIYHLELSIKGFASISDISNTKTANNTIMANTAKASNNITNHTPFVSIVKYASESNIQEPYDPSPLNVAVGTSVKWINNDILPHTVTEGEAAATSYQQSTINKSKFDSGILGPAQTFEHTFVQPGTIKYYCTIHPFMSGEVIVK
jgi:plastocyanin